VGIARPVLCGTGHQAFQVLGSLAQPLSKERFNRLFASVYEHEFSQKVTNSELTKCLYGQYDRRSIQTIAVKRIPKAEMGEIDLPAPRKKGNFWDWTEKEAEERGG